MSIYPVKLNEWYPKKDEYYENAKTVVLYSNCLTCNKKGKNMKYRYVWGDHSIPWGYGYIWCSKECLDKKRIK